MEKKSFITSKNEENLFPVYFHYKKRKRIPPCRNVDNRQKFGPMQQLEMGQVKVIKNVFLKIYF